MSFDDITVQSIQSEEGCIDERSYTAWNEARGYIKTPCTFNSTQLKTENKKAKQKMTIGNFFGVLTYSLTKSMPVY